MPLFIRSDDTVDVDIYYLEEGETYRFARSEADLDGDCEKVSFQIKRPSWGDQRTIMEGSFMLDDNGTPVVDPHRFQDMKFRVLIKGWSLEEDFNEDAIENMNPQLAEYLGNVISEMFMHNKAIGTPGQGGE
jgi:hypothetical protein